jgi:capsular exopolysaccharide synthesis family protein
MSSSVWLSKAAGKPEQGDAVAEERELNNRNGHPITVHADLAYPLLVDHDQVVASEHFSVLRSRILNLHAKSSLRSLIITSPQKGDGKSLVCLNLAISLGQLERHRVLLVDGDLRVKGISRLLGIDEQVGVSDFLRGEVAMGDCQRRTNFPYLSVVGAGTQSEAASPAILEGSKWVEFLEQAKGISDLVVVDSVPVAAPIADFGLLSAPCDGTLLIVHLRKTKREALALTLQQMNGKLLGVIINNLDQQLGSDYYSYYYAKKK